jgi:hypothetical protein
MSPLSLWARLDQASSANPRQRKGPRPSTPDRPAHVQGSGGEFDLQLVQRRGLVPGSQVTP